MKSRSSLLALVHPGGPGKRAIKRLWWCGVNYVDLCLGIKKIYFCVDRVFSWSLALALALASKTNGLGLGLGLDLVHDVLKLIPGALLRCRYVSWS